ncbi:MAG: hypothetical protein GWO24_05980, partial [Akkermansiaceae bacterium]|nr:hypothetical protein [Akkermansiaceae bacterium]
MREEWMRDFNFVVHGEVVGDLGEFSEELWVRRFELGEGKEAKRETAERRMEVLE